MNIRIITFHGVSNFGAVLQAYSLQRYLQSIGHCVSFIDYLPDYTTSGGSFWFPRSRWHLKANLVIAYQKFILLRSLGPATRLQNRLFQQFRNSHLTIEGSTYKNSSQLKSNPPIGDVFICGSDQIWNPTEQAGLDPAFFLDFVPDRFKKIAYAASFGRQSISADFGVQIRQFTQRFHAVSVREESGLSILKNFGVCNATLVPDPTFLLDADGFDFDQPQTHSNNSVIFSYVLRAGAGFYSLQKALAKHLSLEVVQPINPFERWPVYGKRLPMGPVQWLSSIRCASAVLTNSFHGTVFSILFNRPFLTIQLDGKKAPLNARVVHLLQLLNLTDRLVAVNNIDQASRLISTSINWDEVNRKVLSLKMSGRSFLLNSIRLS